MSRARRAVACGLVSAVLVACDTAEMPDVVVTGEGADTVVFDAWEQVVIGGRVVKWEATMTRRRDDPIGYMSYTLYDPEGTALSRTALDYRNSFLYDGQPFEPGDSLPVSLAAHRGDPVGNTVARIEIEIRTP